MEQITGFRRAVLRWFAQHGRKHLPWQQNVTPYRVWVSEIMLQQTQVSTVISYFARFMKRFPTVKTLANASEDEVLHLWTGLGYYSRARNLLKTAKIITHEFNSQFPTDLNTMQTLPGIGRSTAAAILALSMHKRAAILDGNVKRVLARVHAINAWQNIDALWQHAEKYTPKTHVAEYTQAMMDLGAMICTRSNPACLICPLQTYCIAFREKTQTDYPGKKPRKALPIRTVQLILLKNTEGKILLEKRPTKGIWGGLWSLPEYNSNETLQQFCLANYQCQISAINTGQAFRHTFTHFHLDITPIEVKAKPLKRLAKNAENQTIHWYDVKTPANLGLAAPIKKLINNS